MDGIGSEEDLPARPIEYGGGEPVLLLADTRAAAARGRRAVAAAGCRLSGAAPLSGALERLRRQVGASVVLIEMDARPEEPLQPVLRQLNAAARAGRHGSMVVAPRRLLERLDVQALHRDVHLLCGPTGFDRLATLHSLVGRRASRLNDKGSSGPRLQQLSEEVGRIASILAALSAEDGEASGEDRMPVDAGLVRAVIRARRLRDQYFKSDLFADPAWDMLLDLFAARLERQRVAVSSLCIASAVPPTTALRWIRSLSDQGLFVRLADPEDGRRVFIELSDSAAAGMEAYLRAAQRISPLII